MTRNTRLLAVLTPIVFVAASDASAPEMVSGMWRTTLVIAGEKPVTTTRCREPYRLELPPLGDGSCATRRQVISSGVIDVVRMCRGRIVTATGRYGTDGMTLTATGVEFMPGHPVDLRITSARVASCNSP